MHREAVTTLPGTSEEVADKVVFNRLPLLYASLGGLRGISAMGFPLSFLRHRAKMQTLARCRMEKRQLSSMQAETGGWSPIETVTYDGTS